MVSSDVDRETNNNDQDMEVDIIRKIKHVMKGEHQETANILMNWIPAGKWKTKVKMTERSYIRFAKPGNRKEGNKGKGQGYERVEQDKPSNRMITGQGPIHAERV
ncbi:hypothetical protein FQA39_LY12442 [Lamprigera yunnana]|nr:hypothetical protein FQA39_LY12442 [Lamprigera yunnana]